MFDFHRNSLIPYLVICLVYFVIGTFSGLIIDKIVSYFENKYLNQYSIKIKSIISIVSQAVLLIILFGIIELYISSSFAESWQSITPGFIFVSMIFGTSYNLYANIQKLMN